MPSMHNDLRLLPFRGTVAVARGLLTPRQLRSPRWRRVLPDVYIEADVELDHRLWCEAALIYARGPGAASTLASPTRAASGQVAAGRAGAVQAGSGLVAVSGLSAAMLMGVDLIRSDTPIEITVPIAGRGNGSRPGLRIVRADLRPSDIAPFGRLTMTSPRRTAFDLARRLPRTEAVVALDAMSRIVTVAEVTEYALAAGLVRGRRRVFEVLPLVEPLAESPMESRLRIELVGGGLPRPVAQHEVYDAAGCFIGRLDLAYPDCGVGIEYEGDHHRDRAQFRRDLARMNAFAAAGWVVVRVTAADIRNSRQIVGQIRGLLESRDPRSRRLEG